MQPASSTLLYASPPCPITDSSLTKYRCLQPCKPWCCAGGGVRVFVRWGWVRLLSKAAVCTPVLCCAWVCLSLWGSGWCFFCCCCAWRGCAPLSCFLSSLLFLFLAGSAPSPAHPSPTLLDLPFFGVVFLCVGVGKPQSCRSLGVCRVVACFIFPCGGVCTYLPLRGTPLPSGCSPVCSAGAVFLW